jgi:hypothetical protein
MKSKQIKDCAILIGLTPDGQCVYSAMLSLHEYWDGHHVWDEGPKVKKLKLERIKGFLFDSSGDLLQEFESHFDHATGAYKKGWIRHADGTLNKRRVP